MDELLDLQVPHVIRISPDSQSIVYSTTLTFEHKTGEHPVSTLWLAETGKPQSSRPLTSGLFNDREPRWSPDGNHVAFVSDRAKAGESAAIYVLSVSETEPEAVTPTVNERGIERFEWSPDGKSIAYISADEKTEAQQRRETEKDDAQVWGEDWEYGRLRVVHVSTKEVLTLVERDAHVVDLAWSEDGVQIAFSEVKDTEFEAPVVNGTTISILDMSTKKVKALCHYGNKVTHLTWSGDSLFFIAAAREHKNGSSYMAHTVKVGNAGVPDGSIVSKKYAYGEENCALALSKAGPGEIVAYLQNGMEDQLRMLNGRTLFSKKRKIDAWHAAFTHDSDELVLAIAQSSVNLPAEVYSTTASGGAMVQLSQHGQAFAGRQFGSCRFLTCPTKDGKYQLECPFLIPSTAPTNADGTPKEALPTVVLIHGGPYNRHTESFDGLYFMWAPYILSAGYAILLADYRGSSGRGDHWASYGHHVGEHDYNDVVSQTQAAIERGWIDKQHLAVGGYSQGGYLSYLASTRNGRHGHGWHFQAAIPGAGMTDGDTMCLTSDAGVFESEICGDAPWRSAKGDTSNRQMSAIWEFAGAIKDGVLIPPMLILHGADDRRVPLEQAVAMRRALADAGKPYEYVIYPREGHIMKERKHLVDMGVRIVRFLDKHIGPRIK